MFKTFSLLYWLALDESFLWLSVFEKLGFSMKTEILWKEFWTSIMGSSELVTGYIFLNAIWLWVGVKFEIL